MKTGLNSINAYIVNSQFGETRSLSVTSTSSSVSFSLPASKKNYDVIVQNAGDKIAFIAFGNGSATAELPGAGKINAFPILPGAIYSLQKNTSNEETDTCAAICNPTETTTLYFTSVQGS